MDDLPCVLHLVEGHCLFIVYCDDDAWLHLHGLTYYIDARLSLEALRLDNLTRLSALLK